MYAQATISKTKDGLWKLTIQSDKQIEFMMLEASLDAILKEIKFVATKEWHQRS